MKRVIVTGASGFIGQPSVLALRDRGFEVHAISSKYANQHQNGVTWHELNLHNKGEVAAIMAQIKPAYLLHLAWYVEHGKYWSSPENLKWVITSLELAEQFLKHGGRRLVCAGTCAEYDWRGGLCSERSTPI